LRRRIWLHSQRDGFDAAELGALHLWFPGDVAGAVFAVPDRSGMRSRRSRPTVEVITGVPLVSVNRNCGVIDIFSEVDGIGVIRLQVPIVVIVPPLSPLPHVTLETVPEPANPPCRRGCLDREWRGRNRPRSER
jgi:hypothetical protein